MTKEMYDKVWHIAKPKVNANWLAVLQVSSIVDLVKNVPCAVTKRQNLRRALRDYAARFDPCQCAPCPNNGKPVLSGTECLCVCQAGTYGKNCEIRAPGYDSGVWSDTVMIRVWPGPERGGE